MELICLEGVEFAYGDTAVLHGLSLVAHEHEVTVVVGPSGSGKSTVLRLIAGFETPAKGRVLIGGEVVAQGGRIIQPPELRNISMVFQDLALWPHLTVGETLDFVLGPTVDSNERRRRISETTTMLCLEGRIDARPAQLSGGERQRLAIARAIVTQPRTLLMDEPLANLDPPLRVSLLEEIGRLQRRLGLTILYVTHNPQETFILGDRAAVLREGHIEQVGPPRALYEQPRTAFVARLLGRCAILPGVVEDGQMKTALGTFAGGYTGLENGSDVSVMVRPEDVCVSEEAPFEGRVERIAWLSGSFEVELAGPGWRLSALMRDEPKLGSSVRFRIRKAARV
jgi:iron(III) transport system ATP-binding protein